MVRELIRVERKRVIGRKLWFLVIGICVAVSAFITIQNYNSYEILDTSGKPAVSAKKNLKESKRKEYRKELNQEGLEDILLKEDRSSYVHDINEVRLLLRIYPDKKFSEISTEALEQFYSNREALLEDAAVSGVFGKLTDSKIEEIKKLASAMKTPLVSGYAEGWKNLNNNLGTMVLITLGVITILLLPIFSGTAKSDMSELCNATRNGKKKMVAVKLAIGIEIATIIYIFGILCLTILHFLVFGTEGYDLLIQSDQYYIFSILNINYISQWGLCVLIGYLTVIFMTGIILFCSSVTGKLLDSGIMVAFFWIIIYAIPYNYFRAYGMTHYVSSFLPNNLTKFNMLYRMNDVYEILGVMIPAYVWIPIVISAMSVVLFGIVYFMQHRRLRCKTAGE